MLIPCLVFPVPVCRHFFTQCNERSSEKRKIVEVDERIFRVRGRVLAFVCRSVDLSVVERPLSRPEWK